MKHPSNQRFFAYWDEKRAESRAPDRSDIEPEAVRELLPDIFVLSCEASARYAFRVAGTRLCALLGHDLKDRSFLGLFDAEGRRDIETVRENTACSSCQTHEACEPLTNLTGAWELSSGASDAYRIGV